VPKSLKFHAPACPPPKTFDTGGILFSGVPVRESVRPENFVNTVGHNIWVYRFGDWMFESKG